MTIWFWVGVAVFFAAVILIALSLAMAARRGDEMLQQRPGSGPVDALGRLGDEAEALWSVEALARENAGWRNR